MARMWVFEEKNVVNNMFRKGYHHLKAVCIAVLFLVCASFFCACGQAGGGAGTSAASGNGAAGPAGNAAQAAATGEVRVHFLDVGQADSILVTSGGQCMLVDGGNWADGNKVADYIEGLGFESIDVVVGTHAHEDHMAGLVDVLKRFHAGVVYASPVSNNTATYRSFIKQAERQGVGPVIPDVGATWTIGSATVTVLADGSKGYAGGDSNGSSNYNNASIVLRMDVGADSFLFMGDAESEVEFALIDSGANIAAEVLKVAHHGSKDATYWQFLNVVQPRYAVIEVGRNNDYGYPKDKTVDRLEDAGVEAIFRTDNDHTTVAATTGGGITWTTNGPNLDGDA